MKLYFKLAMILMNIKNKYLCKVSLSKTLPILNVFICNNYFANMRIIM